MPSYQNSIAVTGMGVVCSAGDSVEAFTEALTAGRSGITRRLDAQGKPLDGAVKVAATVSLSQREAVIEHWLAAEPERYGRVRRILRTGSASVPLSVCAALEAFRDARLDGKLSSAQAVRTGLIVAGSNLHQDFIAASHQRFAEEERLTPRYALAFFDTHQVGVLSELLGIRGPGVTLGAASASGNAALFNAAQWLRSGVVDRVLVVGASSGLSAIELEAFALIGAASGSDDPATACCPFDVRHSGFVWGEGSGALVLETAAAARERRVVTHGHLLGASLLLDGNHLPDPSLEGEIAAMRAALADASLPPTAIGYLNAHGSSSPLGDKTECAAIHSLFGEATPIVNATKAFTGHCISASGVIEAIATLIQLQHGFVHPNPNLYEAVDPVIRFAGRDVFSLNTHYALSNAFGFGGINSSLVFAGSEL